MANQVFPTKGNLLASKKTLGLSRMGFDLMDKKRTILIREMMLLMEQSKMLRGEIDGIYERAYLALQKANIVSGVIRDVAEEIPYDEGISIAYRSVMGVDIPKISHEAQPLSLTYGLYETNSQLDYAYQCFDEVKKITLILAEVDNAACRLANAIVKTQRRANALKNVVIPRLEGTVKFISDSLEEKEREEFSRLKVIKGMKERAGL